MDKPKMSNGKTSDEQVAQGPVADASAQSPDSRAAAAANTRVPVGIQVQNSEMIIGSKSRPKTAKVPGDTW